VRGRKVWEHRRSHFRSNRRLGKSPDRRNLRPGLNRKTSVSTATVSCQLGWAQSSLSETGAVVCRIITAYPEVGRRGADFPFNIYDSFRIAAPDKFVNAGPLHAKSLVAVLSTGISDNFRIAPHSYFHC